MKDFLKNNGHIIRILLFLAIVIFAAGRLHTIQAELCRQIKLKLDRDLYERDRTHLQEQLKRIEVKIDALIRANQGITGIGGDQEPGN